MLLSNILLNWYDKSKRILPFRGEKDPYKIWISEIMLQQTKVESMIPYYNKWISKYPTVNSVASSNEEDLLKEWQGLGYYSRCRNLFKACKIIVEDYNYEVPNNWENLISLPGIGDYTASAILSIAYNKKYSVVDGNVKRVMSRLFCFKNFTTRNKKIIKSKLDFCIPSDRPGDFNQAIMELGAVVCTPSNPKCHTCPVNDFCKAYAIGRADAYPMQKRKIIKTIPNMALMIWDKNKFLIRKRSTGSFLNGMWEIPNFDFIYNESTEKYSKTIKKLIRELNFNIKNERYLGKVKQIYSHFCAEIHLFICESNQDSLKLKKNHNWINIEEISKYPFSNSSHKLFSLYGKEKLKVEN